MKDIELNEDPTHGKYIFIFVFSRFYVNSASFFLSMSWSMNELKLTWDGAN